jgi:site-specific DNA-cytosine methylase
LYWANWDITQPDDKGIVLKDILVEGYGDSVADQGTTVKQTNVDKAACLLARDYKGFGNQAMTGVRTCELREYDKDEDCHHVGTALDINGHDILKRVYSDTGKSPTLNTMGGGNREPKVLTSVDKGTYRPLLPLEMERLQTLPDNYTDGVSNTQRKKMLGNGWTVDVIVHILKQGGFA